MNTTKIRGDSLSARLTPEQREELLVLLVEQRASYAEGLELVKSWGLDSSIGALANFYARERSSWSLSRARRYAEELAGVKLDEMDEAERKLVAQQAFELAATPDIPPKVLLKMRDQQLKLIQLQHDARKLALLEEENRTLKAEKEKAVAAINNAPVDGMSAATRDAVRAALGMTA